MAKVNIFMTVWKKDKELYSPEFGQVQEQNLFKIHIVSKNVW